MTQLTKKVSQLTRHLLPARIRSKLLLFYGLSIVMLFSVMWSINYFGLPFDLYEGEYYNGKAAAIQKLNAAADEKKSEIEHWLDERVDDMKLCANDPVIKSSIRSLVTRTHGSDQTGVDAILAERLDYFKNSFKFDGIEIINFATGSHILSTDKKSIGAKKCNMFDELFSRGTDWTQKVLIGRPDNESELFLYYAYLNKGGANSSLSSNAWTAMVIRVSMENPYLSEILHGSELLGESGEVVLIDMQRRLLAPLKFKLTDGTTARLLNQQISTSPAEYASWGIDSTMEAPDYRGVPVIAAIRHVRVTPELGIGIIVKQDQREILAPLITSFYTSGIVILTGMIALLGLMYLVTTNFLRPLETLSSAVSRIESGDLTARARHESGDEVGLLGHTFNLMADRVQMWREELEATVLQRTNALLETNKKLQYEIDERKIVENALQVNKKLFSLFMLHSPIYVYIKDVTGTESQVLQASENFHEMIGVPGSQMIGKTMEELFPPEFAAKITADDLTVVKNGEVAKLDEELNGRYYTTIKFPLVMGEKTLVAGYTIDITDRKKAELALEQAAIEWSAAMDASADIIYMLDAKRHLTRANKAFYSISGKTPEESIGAHIADIMHPNVPLEDCPVCRAQNDKQEISIVMEKDNPANNLGLPLDITVRIIRDKDGQPVNILTMMHDLSHDRKAQEEKARLEMQLFQSQKMEAVGLLAGGIAHDFNNMLTAIIGFGSLLKAKLDDDSELNPFVDQILSSAEKSTNLTRQLLAFSRKQEIITKLTDLNDLIRNIEKLLLRIIGEDIELKTQLFGKALVVMIDPGQIEQVLLNLCTNARDAMAGGGLLSICTDTVELDENYMKTHDLEKPGMYAILSVTDSGKGMDENTRMRIFEPFFTTKELGKGTGLGLSIVYGIIKQHNGNILVYSELGKGTTFKIYLPIVKANIEDIKNSKAAAPKRGTETVLIAEDNEDVRNLSKKILEQYGYKVIDAMDGEDAINKFNENKESIKLVMLDVIMPKKNGKETSDEIKKINPLAKILFISGYTSDIISEKGILDEGMDFISKPVTPQDLLIKIREMLDK